MIALALWAFCFPQTVHAEGSPTSVMIMLPSSTGLVPVPRSVPSRAREVGLADQASSLIELILAGPTPEEEAQGIWGAFPPGAQLAGVEFDPAEARLRAKIDFPGSFLADPGQVETRIDWINETIIKTLQELPIRGWQVLARQPGSASYVPLDRFLPESPFAKYETTPDTATIPEGVEPIETPRSLEQYPRTGGARPEGALSGKAVYLNPGHGWVWGTSSGDDYWRLQRGFVEDNYEDLSNVDLVNQYLFAYCYNAGADVFSVREVDPNKNMTIVDNDDGNDGTKGYFESGTDWTNSSLAGFANGHIPYLSGEDPFSFGHNRLARCTTGAPTCSASWVPEIPAAGWHNVYVSHAAYSNRSPQAHYRIFHAGGQTDYFLDQRRRRFTWIFIGSYYFEAGVNPDSGKVVLFNGSSSSLHYVSADAVRFGGGTGLISRGASGVSGQRRYDEEARYQIQFCGAPDYDGSGGDEQDGWSRRPGFARWLKQSAEAYGAPAQDSVFISSHTNAGGGSGLDTFVHTGSENTWHDDLRNFVHDEVLNDLSKGYSPSFKNHGVGKRYGDYSENNPYNVSDLMPIFLGEWLFHDSAADMALYHDPKFRRMLARAIYQGIVKFWADRQQTPVHLLPEPPRNLRIRQLGADTAWIEWDPPLTDSQGIAGDPATGYRVYVSEHGRGFPPGTPVAGTSSVMANLTPGKTYYFYVTATNPGGESFPTDVLAVKTGPGSGVPVILLVNGFDKLDIATRVAETHAGKTVLRQILSRMNTYDYIVEHARAVDAYTHPIAFNSCEDEAIEAGYVNLSERPAVIWIGGIQAEVSATDPTNDTALTGDLQSQLAAYLNSGGRLFISGARIAWDLDRSAPPPTFVNSTLTADYAGDNTSMFRAVGAAGSIFEGMTSFRFGTGTQTPYVLSATDVLGTIHYSVAALNYTSAGAGLGNDARLTDEMAPDSIAAVQYQGVYKLIYLAFPFETIWSASKQAGIMGRTLDFFGFAPQPSHASFWEAY